MYSIYQDLFYLKSKNEILDLVNDENIPYTDINLDDTNNLCRRRIDEAIQSADAEIDTYLNERYSLPLAEAPVLIKYISRALALEALFFRRVPDAVPGPVMNDAKAKRIILKNLAEGLIGLGIEKPAVGKFITNKSSADRQFTEDELKNY